VLRQPNLLKHLSVGFALRGWARYPIVYVGSVSCLVGGNSVQKVSAQIRAKVDHTVFEATQTIPLKHNRRSRYAEEVTYLPHNTLSNTILIL
jgi:hypothetical protein